LDGWPDAAGGLERLRNRFIVATLSNGNVSLLANMAKYAGLHWDVVLSAEQSRHYKPDPESYLSAAELLSLEPEEVMMVAAHEGDLKHAGAVGFRTGFVHRPLEGGPGRKAEKPTPATYDVVADDFHDLANQLGA
jgi:2-haloacid dehalogenase